MTDRELLEAAARAAGYTVEDRGGWFTITDAEGVTAQWLPLESDRDAFRLMVDCGIDLVFEPESVHAYVHPENSEYLFQHYGTDKHAATRRAITRAAAAMGAGK